MLYLKHHIDAIMLFLILPIAGSAYSKKRTLWKLDSSLWVGYNLWSTGTFKTPKYSYLFWVLVPLLLILYCLSLYWPVHLVSARKRYYQPTVPYPHNFLLKIYRVFRHCLGRNWFVKMNHIQNVSRDLLPCFLTKAYFALHKSKVSWTVWGYDMYSYTATPFPSSRVLEKAIFHLFCSIFFIVCSFIWKTKTV